jgi:predicted RNase H-like HicB family nuclease
MATKVLVPQIAFDVKLIVNPDGSITIECPSLPGCISQGRNRREALKNIREAISAWLEGEQEARRRGWKPVWERRSP